MRNGRTSVFGFLVLCTCLAGCSKSNAYLVPGLTLPLSAVVASSEFTPVEQPTTGVKQTLEVRFDCPDGWDAVVQHVRACLEPAGYKAASQDVSSWAGGQNSGERAPEVNLVFSKTGSPYSVSLQNIKGLKELTSKLGMDTSALPLAHESCDFLLRVIESASSN